MRTGKRISRSRAQARKILKSTSAGMVGYAAEPLERRTLLSMLYDSPQPWLAPAEVEQNEASTLVARLNAHTLTAEDMQALNVAEVRWQGRMMYARKNQWLVDLKGGAPAVEVLNNLGYGPIFKRTLGREDLALVQLPDGVGYDLLAGPLARRQLLDFAEPNGIVWKAATPNDQYYASQWALNNTGQSGGTADADIDAPEAWDLTTGSSSVVVAVIDSGVEYSHTDLSANMWTNTLDPIGDLDPDGPGPLQPDGNPDDDGNGIVDDYYGADFGSTDELGNVDPDGDPREAGNDPTITTDDPHGTPVAGIIGAKAQTGGGTGTGVAGISWNVQIMALKVFDDDGGSAADWASVIDALEYVVAMKTRATAPANVRVVNYSLTGGAPTEPLALKTAIKGLRDPNGDSNTADGILFVAAASNDGNNNDDGPENARYPANLDLDNIVTVAATDRKDVLADFRDQNPAFFLSNFGSDTVDLGAPGKDLYTTTFTGTMPSRTYTYGLFSGTSAAAPMVSGVAALAFAYKPTATYDVVRDAILQGTDANTSLTGTTITGGRLNANNTLAYLSNTVLSVNGDDDAVSGDSIEVRLNPSDLNTLQVLVDGSVRGFAAVSSVSWVRVRALDGGDVMTVNTNVPSTVRIMLDGGKGADNITGGAGNDWLIGGLDWLDGSSDGNDTLTGNGGNDLLTGGAGVDSITGGAGDDRINGGADDDATLDGGTENDFIGGGPGNDTLTGNAGNDVLTGAGGDDDLLGGTGSDTYLFTLGPGITGPGAQSEFLGTDAITEGANADTDLLDFTNFYQPLLILDLALEGDRTSGAPAHSSGVTLYISDGTPFPATNTAIENVKGTGSADEIRGNAGNNTIWGHRGDDIIRGLFGTDTLIGGDGNDTFDMWNGVDGGHDGAGDVLEGNAGSDTADYSSRNQNLTISLDNVGNDGQRDIDPILPGNQSEGDNIKTDVEKVFAGSGSDSLTAGGVGVELRGGPGSDNLYGGSGNDILFGEVGNDYLQGNAGNDSLDGGSDNDRVYGDYPAFTGFTGDDLVKGGAGADTVVGGMGNDTAEGGPDNDMVWGDDPAFTTEGGEDIIRGEFGDDGCYGGAEVDLMEGGDGNDVFDAADGFIDTLDGGPGTDSIIARDDNDIVINIP